MADALSDVGREIHTRVAESTAADAAPTEGVPEHSPTLSELGVPLRRMGRSRKGALGALAAAAAAVVFWWRSAGSEVTEANASMNGNAADAATDAPMATPSPGTPASEACRPFEGNPAQLAAPLPAPIEGILATSP
jgi:hypothetical protein